MKTKKSERVLAQVLDECVERMLQGDSAAACLARYPEYAVELAQLLESISRVRRHAAVPQRQPAAEARSRAQYLAAVEGLAAGPAPVQRSGLARWWDQVVAGFQVLRPVPAGLVAAVVCAMLVGLLTTGVVTVSASALPGDALYSVKLATEQARLLLARDQQARDTLGQEIAGNRVSEAKAILLLGRTVGQMPLAGRLDDFGPAEWLISGLPVQVNDGTTIVGIPAVGVSVRGSVRAPGDGSLIALYLEVGPAGGRPGESQTPGGLAVPASPTLAPTQPVMTVTNTPVPTRRVGTDGLQLPPDVFPTRTPRPEPGAPPRRRAPMMPAPSATASSMPLIPTAAFTATPAPAPTATDIPNAPPTRPNQKQHLTDAFVNKISGSLWTVGGVTVEVDGNTQIIGQPAVGDTVDLEMVLRPGQPPLALLITLRSKAPTPQPIEFSGRLQRKDGTIWTVSGIAFMAQADTVIAGNPQVGDWVKCTGARYANGGVRGYRIEKLTLRVVEFTGVIEAIADGQWQVAGQAVLVQSGVLISGAPPAVGRLADVRAEQLPDGRLLAKAIYVLPATPTPTSAPTVTDKPGPLTATTVPTATDTPVPPTATTAPAAIDTPVPPTEPPPTNTLAAPRAKTVGPRPSPTLATPPPNESMLMEPPQ